MSSYTPTQIHQFYDRINLPQQHRHEPGPTSRSVASAASTGLPFLAALQKYSLTSIPFENLSLHYSPHHSIDVSPAAVFSKVVSHRDGKSGRGGYCMENNTLMLHVLRALGFDVTSTGARISSSVAGRPAPLADVGFSGWSHMVNLVAFPDTPTAYLVDVGFGGRGPTRPVALSHSGDGFSNVAPSLRGRLVRAQLPGTHSGQRFWVYESKGPDGPWSPCYCFSEVEFLQGDFGVMNHWTSTSEQSWFTKVPVCVRMVLEEGTGEIVGTVQVFGGEFKERRGDRETTRSIGSEGERIGILEKEFGIAFEREEREGIKGMVSELKAE